VTAGLLFRELAYRAAGAFLQGFDGKPGLKAPLDNPTTIIVIRLDEIGDCVMTIPFLKGLRAAAAQATIVVVMPPPVAELLDCQGLVDLVLPFGRPREGLAMPIRAASIARFGRHRLRPLHPDVVILPRWDADHPDSFILAATSGAPIRVGYSEYATADRRIYGRGSDSLMTHTYDDPGARHEVERGLRLLELIGGGTADANAAVHPCASALRRVDELLARSPQLPLVAFGIGAGDPKRRWSASAFAAVANDLVARDPFCAVIVGSMEDRPAAEEFARIFRGSSVDLAGRTSLVESHAALARCALFVGNDSGPMHLAASVGVPVVAVSGLPVGTDPQHPNAPERFRPWNVTHVVVRPEADPNSDGELRIDRVGVADVARAAHSLWDPNLHES
jgi:ADP-heptose:LPS heptosyltransferase